MPKSAVISTIHNPAVRDGFYEQAESIPDHEWLLNKQSPVLLSCGRFVKQKDFPTLIKALAIVRKTNRARLIILGDGDERKTIESCIADLELEDCVSLPGYEKNPLAYMRAADLFVLSSRWEGFGIVVAEALGCGTQVVSTDCPNGPREILGDGKWGRLVPIQDPKNMAQAILASLAHPVATPEQLKVRAADFHVDRVVQHYIDALQLTPSAG